jgi:bromodomain-containing factor 1
MSQLSRSGKIKPSLQIHRPNLQSRANSHSVSIHHHKSLFKQSTNRPVVSNSHSTALNVDSVSIPEADHRGTDGSEYGTDRPSEFSVKGSDAPRLPESTEVEPDKAMEEEPVMQPSGSSPASTGPDANMQDTPASNPATDLPHHPASISKPDITDSNSPVSETAIPSSQERSDLEMPDASASSTKVLRERDADPDDEPAAKRTKTNGDVASKTTFKVPELPTPTTAASIDDLVKDGPAITKVQQKFLNKTVMSLKRTHDARYFKDPVDPVRMNIPSYPLVVSHPMDLSTIERKLKSDLYPSVDAVVGDFSLMVQNALTFNGPDHLVTQEGQKLKTTFEKQLANLPKPDEVEEKKPKKAPAAAPRATPVRRESRTSGGAVAPPAASTSGGGGGGNQNPPRQNASSPQGTTFALGPEGLPLIRRDSTNADGRPKRSIHPPKRDIPYSAKPKKKKYQWELKFCEEVLEELHKPKYFNIASPFYVPVDPVALNIPTYHNVIKKPMDLSTVRAKLKAGQYENAKEMEVDMRQILKNCFKFNILGDPTYVAGQKFEELFEDKWGLKARWLETHDPASAHHSVGSSDMESEEEDSDDDAEQEKLSRLQKQIAEMSKQVEAITQKKKKTPPAPKKSGKTKPTKKESKKPVAKKDKKSSSKNTKPEKHRYVTYHEKQVISNGISSLPDKKMQEALRIIQNNVPHLKVCSCLGCCLSTFFLFLLLGFPSSFWFQR